MNVIAFELRSRFKSFTIWFTSFLAVLLLFLSMYPSFATSAETIKQVLKSYPPELLKAVGFNIDTFTSFLGFYGYILTYLGMVMFTFACASGIASITVEKIGHLNDFLFVRPISRGRIWLSKFLVAMFYVTLFITLFTLIIGIVFRIGNISVDMRLLGQIQIGVYLTSLMLLALGFLFATYLDKVRFPGVVGLISIVVLFLLKLIVSFSNVENLRYISPLSYFDTSIILSKNGYEIQDVIISLLVIAALLSMSGYRYIKKDTK